MRIRPFRLAALCLLAPLVSAVGAPASIRDQVEALLATLAPNENQPEIDYARRKAKAALARADEGRAATEEDERSAAAVVEQTALEWAQMTKELSELDALQSKADAAEKQLDALEAQLKREKAHLEETEARRGRAVATLERLGSRAPAPTPSTTKEPKP